MKQLKYFLNFHICFWYYRRFVILFILFFQFIHLLFRNSSTLLPYLLSYIFLNNLFFSLNLLFHLQYFWQDYFKLLHIREYQDRLNIILTWSKTIIYHCQHDRLNLKSFFHHLKRVTWSCWYNLNDRVPISKWSSAQYRVPRSFSFDTR